MVQSCRGDFLKQLHLIILMTFFFLKSLSPNYGFTELQTQELRRKQRAVNAFREHRGQ